MLQRFSEWFRRQTTFLQILTLTVAVGISFSTIGYGAYEPLAKLIGSTTSGSAGALSLCAATTSAPTYTTAQNHPISCQTDGSLRAYITGSSVGSVSNDDDGSVAGGATGHSTVLALEYLWDSATSAWTRFTHQLLDYDSGAGTENLSVIGIALPGSGGPVAGGTSTNPFNTTDAGTGGTADAAATAGSTGSLNAKTRLMTSQLDSIKTAVELIDNLTTDPCASLAKTFLPINISTATTTEITPSLAGSSTHYYVCSLIIWPVAGAQTLAVVDDDSDGCGSVTSGLAGGTTAASGATLAINQGWVAGAGGSTIMKTNGTNRVICIVTGQAVQTSGVMSVVAAP